MSSCENVLAKAMSTKALIAACPNPVIVTDYSGLGVTNLTWLCTQAEAVEVRVDAPDGPLLSRTGPTGDVVTGKWVRDGMRFFLVDVSAGRPGETLASVTVQVISSRFTSDLPARPHPGAPAGLGEGFPRVLVGGWFSFLGAGATAGDVLSRNLVCEWLGKSAIAYDVAAARPFAGGVDWETADPSNYSHVVFVCGPFDSSELTRRFLRRFSGRRMVGLNLSMIQPLDQFNPFDILFERDSSAAARPDLVFLASRESVPVAGLVLVEPVAEYQDRAMHEYANQALLSLATEREITVVEIDTRLESNITGLRSAAEIENLIARMDVVLTTRLHGLVLALKNGVPALAVDPHSGGSKVVRQARTLGWSAAFTAEELSSEALHSALDYCLSEGARSQARECRERARSLVAQLRDEFVATLRKEVHRLSDT